MQKKYVLLGKQLAIKIRSAYFVSIDKEKVFTREDVVQALKRLFTEHEVEFAQKLTWTKIMFHNLPSTTFGQLPNIFIRILNCSEDTVSDEEVIICINAVQSRAMTEEEEALGVLTRRKLKNLSTWPKWQAGEFKQLDCFHALRMCGEPIAHPTDPAVIILRPLWQYKVKNSGKRRSRNCCDGSLRAAPAVHGIASTYSSCVAQPVQRLLFALAAPLGHVVMLQMLMLTQYQHMWPSMMPMQNGTKHISEKRQLTGLMFFLCCMPYKDTLNPDSFGRIISTRFYYLLSSVSDILHMIARSIQLHLIQLHLMVNLYSCSVKLMTSLLLVRMRQLLNTFSVQLVTASNLNIRIVYPLCTLDKPLSTMAWM